MLHFVPQSRHARGLFVSYTLERGGWRGVGGGGGKWVAGGVKSQRLTACNTQQPTELPFQLVYIAHNYVCFNTENQFYVLSLTYIINSPHLFI